MTNTQMCIVRNVIFGLSTTLDRSTVHIMFDPTEYDLDRSTTHPKLHSTGIRTHDFHIMDSIFHVPEMLALTTEPSGTLILLYKG